MTNDYRAIMMARCAYDAESNLSKGLADLRVLVAYDAEGYGDIVDDVERVIAELRTELERS